MFSLFLHVAGFSLGCRVWPSVMAQVSARKDSSSKRLKIVEWEHLNRAHSHTYNWPVITLRAQLCSVL